MARYYHSALLVSSLPGCAVEGDVARVALVLADFGAQSDTAWARENLYQLVNYRMHPGAPRPAHSGHGQLMEREFAQYHGRIASRLKTAVHVHISAPDARGKIARGIVQ